MNELNDEELLSALGVETETEVQSTGSKRENRIISGFEEIKRFSEVNNRNPLHGEERNIFERILAVRLDRIKNSEEFRNILLDSDKHDFLRTNIKTNEIETIEINDEVLLSKLGVNVPEDSDLTNLKHVKTRAEKRASEEIARRIPCVDFEKFKPYFQQVQFDLQTDQRQAVDFKKTKMIEQGDLFILGGQKAFVAALGEEYLAEYGITNRRLRVVYDNGTESDILMLSFLRALYKDETARKIIDVNEIGPLFSGIIADEDTASGTVYVLRSKSNHPMISKNREIIHKIGVTKNIVSNRIGKAEIDPTFLMSEVEIVATYSLANINRSKLETIIHKFFESARLEIKINDRFGNPVAPEEWFLVPIFIIDEAIERIRNGSIVNCHYDAKKGKIIDRS
jgi:hypothetical protein